MYNSLLFAYLDPGSGSMLLQALIGGGAGLFVMVKHLFRSWKFRRAAKSGVRAAK